MHESFGNGRHPYRKDGSAIRVCDLQYPFALPLDCYNRFLGHTYKAEMCQR